MRVLEMLRIGAFIFITLTHTQMGRQTIWRSSLEMLIMPASINMAHLEQREE